MSDQPFTFTREERVRLLEALLPSLVALKPTKYPPDKNGGQKVGHLDHVVAVWASRIIRAAESVEQSQRDYEEKRESGAVSSGGASNGSPL